MRHGLIRLIVVGIALAALSGCTVVSYCPLNQPCVRVVDFHPAGGDVELLIHRADGTVVWAARGQPSSEEIITGVVNAINPAGGLLP